MVDVVALQAAYNDAVVKGNKKLANELLALWRDTLANKAHRRSLSTGRRATLGRPEDITPESGNWRA
jgi:hypothetical protein